MNLVALDGALYPTVAKVTADAADDVLHVNLAVLAIDDVHAIAVLLTAVEVTIVHINIETSAVVGLEFALRLLGDHAETCLVGLEVLHVHLGHLFVDHLVALQGMGALEVHACRCADSDCGCNQKYR